jgi:Uma2 family endonuclease
MGTKTLLTVEQFEQLGETDERYELVDGELVMQPMPTFEHDDIRDSIVQSLREYLKRNPIGRAVAERGMQTAPNTVRRADAAFYKGSRIKPDWWKKNVLPVADVVVEVVSPSEKVADLRTKIREYLDAGAETVWVIHPQTKEADIWERDSSRNRVTALEAACLPGFSLPVSSLFELPEFSE